jgi:hypothetical protein
MLLWPDDKESQILNKGILSVGSLCPNCFEDLYHLSTSHYRLRSEIHTLPALKKLLWPFDAKTLWLCILDLELDLDLASS